MKRILVPVDFSVYSENAFKSALKMAEKSNASITCLNVVNSTIDWNNLSPKAKARHQDILDSEAEAKDKLQSFIKDHKTNETPVEAVVEVGIPAAQILEIAGRQNADLIVIGAYGIGHEPGKFIGSTLQTVMRKANCPVLGVKKTVNGNDLKKITFASLFSEESKPAFGRIKPIIKSIGSSVHFLYINSPHTFSTSEKMEKLMLDFKSGQEDLTIHQHIYNHDEVENGIIAFSEGKKTGIIAIVAKQRRMAAYHTGVTETVLFKSDIPVLSVKMEE
ncbi:universal stress protein [Anditalea andensis]|uniref:Universal stress protein UspA n=1 Tax=Anditalea andensis TaxID=1048983 RepID=A0A074L1R3_9BACT|nr:universal stress protein [Anditalea andensis]KEO73808.1 universal stress protein UspA [Anditalea andensis]